MTETAKPDHEPVKFDPSKTVEENVQAALNAPVIPDKDEDTEGE